MECSINKEKVIKSVFYFISYGSAFTLGLFLPNAIASAIGINLTKNFCNQSPNICNQYAHEIPRNPNITLLTAVKGSVYFDSILNSFTGAILLATFLGICNLAYNHCKAKKINNNENENTALLANHQNTNRCCLFFKKFKEKILPTPLEILQLVMITIGLIGASALVTYLLAADLSETICTSLPNSKLDCDAFYLNATKPELDSVKHLSDKVFNAAMSSGVILGALINVGMAVGAMALAAAVKYCVQKTIDQRAEGRNANNNINNAPKYNF